jgi:Zn-dependent alcohol dehydrogenase
MKARRAVLRGYPGKYEVVDLVIDEPRHNELTVRVAASGMCHSDDHLATGDIPMENYPVCGGHEGAGIVEKVWRMTPGFGHVARVPSVCHTHELPCSPRPAQLRKTLNLRGIGVRFVRQRPRNTA